MLGVRHLGPCPVAAGGSWSCLSVDTPLPTPVLKFAKDHEGLSGSPCAITRPGSASGTERPANKCMARGLAAGLFNPSLADVPACYTFSPARAARRGRWLRPGKD